MLIREASDWHTEFWELKRLKSMLRYRLPRLDTDKETVLLLAGDIGTFRLLRWTIKPVLEILAERFRHVIYVYGNHEWYNSCVWGAEKEIWKEHPLPENVTVLQNDFKVIDDVVFIGATLWTDFDNSDELAMDYARRGMNDFYLIRTRYVPDADQYILRTLPSLTPAETVTKHHWSRKYIFSACEIFGDVGYKRVVLTHHTPSPLSIYPTYLGSLLNAAFHSDLSKEIEHNGPDLWFHGHTHDSFDYMLHKTRVICNPLGYYKSPDQNEKYDPKLMIEI